jgi:hypothetical protein
MGYNSFMRISAQRGPSSTKNSIGFDEDTLMKEFERAFKELDLVKNSVEGKDVRRIQRASLKPMVERFKSNITEHKKPFKVYRNGGVYAEIPSGTLKDSIGIINHKVRKGSLFSALSVGAKVKGKFADAEKGGWFAHFVEYGFINSYGQFVKSSQNFGFAEKAKKNGLALVRATFKMKMKMFLDRRIKKSIA